MTEEIEPAELRTVGDIPLPKGLIAVLHGLISVVAFAMMALIFVDVFLRYGFNKPLPGAFEIEQFMLALLVFLSLPIVVWTDENISVALFANWFRGRAAKVLKTCIMVVNVAALCLLGQLVLRQFTSMQDSEMATGFLEIPIYPLAMAMFLLVALAVLIQIAMLWHHVTQTFGAPNP